MTVLGTKVKGCQQVLSRWVRAWNETASDFFGEHGEGSSHCFMYSQTSMGGEGKEGRVLPDL